MNIVYNTTFVMEEATRERFVTFMRAVYVPGLLCGGVLHEPKLMRIQPAEGDEDQALSYALQFVVQSKSALQSHLRGAAKPYVEELKEVFGDSLMSFTTLMQLEAL